MPKSHDCQGRVVRWIDQEVELVRALIPLIEALTDLMKASRSLLVQAVLLAIFISTLL